MIKEVLVVEGKMDVVAIDKAVEADCIITEGFNLKPQALKNIEQAKPDAIRKALEKVRTLDWEPTDEFSGADLIVNNLSGAADASQRRARLGAILGLGFANAKTFLKRLNHYGVTREEFAAAVAQLDKEDGK